MSDQNQFFGVSFDKFFDDMGFAEMSDEKKNAMVDKIAGILEDRIMLKLVGSLSEEDAKAIQAMSELEEVMTYLDGKGFNITELAAQEAMDFREEMIGNMSYVQGLIDNEAQA